MKSHPIQMKIQEIIQNAIDNSVCDWGNWDGLQSQRTFADNIHIQISYWSLKSLNKIERGLNWMMNNLKIQDPALTTLKVCISWVKLRNSKISADAKNAFFQWNTKAKEPNVWKKKTWNETEEIILEVMEKEFQEKWPIEAQQGSDQLIGIELEAENAPYHSPHHDFQSRSDGSLSSNGREYVSWPMTVEDALNSFSELCHNLRISYPDARGESSCGLHFHIGIDTARHWDHNYLDNLEDALIEYIRKCIDSNEMPLLRLFQRSGEYYCVLKKCREVGDRYCAVNLKAIRKHGTIEVRICGVDRNFRQEWVEQFKQFVISCYEIVYPRDWKYIFTKSEGFSLMDKFPIEFAYNV